MKIHAMRITIEDINDNLKTLPEELYVEVNDFVDLLKSKEDIPEWQKVETRRRMRYLQENPKKIISESKMEIYLEELENEK